MRIKLVLSLLVVFLFCFESLAEAQGRRGGGAGGVSRTALAQNDLVQDELELNDEQKASLAEMRGARGQRGQRRQRGEGDAKGGRGEGKGGGRGEGKGGGRGEGKGGGRGEGKGGGRGEGDAKGGGQRGGGQRGGGQRGGGQRGGQTLEQVEEEIAKLSDVLLEHQVARLNEIYVQAMGARAIQDPAVADALEITEDQKTEMQDLQAEMREEMMSLRDTVEREEMREKMTEMMASLSEKQLAVLTDSQTKKLEEMKGDKFELPEDALRQRGGGRRGQGGGDRSDF